MANTAQKLHQEAVSLFQAGKYDAARQKLQDALEHADDSRKVAEIYNDLGVVYKELEDFPAAYAALNEAMSRFGELGDKKGEAQTLGNRAAVQEAEGQLEQAVETYKQAAAMLEDLGESEMAMYVWQAVSRLRMKQGQYIAAIGAYEEGVENMPKRSLKKKFLQRLLKMPGGLLGGAGKRQEKDDES